MGGRGAKKVVGAKQRDVDAWWEGNGRGARESCAALIKLLHWCMYKIKK
jgi:hypothetical protein